MSTSAVRRQEVRLTVPAELVNDCQAMAIDVGKTRYISLYLTLTSAFHAILVAFVASSSSLHLVLHTSSIIDFWSRRTADVRLIL